MKKTILTFIPLLIMASFLVTGCVDKGATDTASQAKPAAEAPGAKAAFKGKVYKGKVTNISNKAKLIAIQVGKGKKAKTMQVKFDDNTQGIKHASKGHASIIAYEMRNGQAWATVIKPKLAKLPKGVEVIAPNEVKELIAQGVDFELIDSRPGARYSEAHLPGAISIPVCKMQELIQNLPKDKDKLLVFYCGGPT